MTPISLPSLRSLSLGTVATQQLVDVVSLIASPALESLHLEGHRSIDYWLAQEPDVALEVLLAFLERCNSTPSLNGSKLTHLTLTSLELPSSVITALFDHLPSLKSLRLSNMSMALDTVRILRALAPLESDEYPCLKLRTITLSDVSYSDRAGARMCIERRKEIEAKATVQVPGKLTVRVIRKPVVHGFASH